MFEFLLTMEDFRYFIFTLQEVLNNIAFALKAFFESVCIFLIFLIYMMALRALVDFVYYFAIAAILFIFH